MYQFVSKSQMRITLAATGFFQHFLPGVGLPGPVAPMFRQEGEGMNVSLTTEDGPDVFVARETIGRNATTSDIYDACDRLIRALIHSHHTVQLANLKGYR